MGYRLGCPKPPAIPIAIPAPGLCRPGPLGAPPPLLGPIPGNEKSGFELSSTSDGLGGGGPLFCCANPGHRGFTPRCDTDVKWDVSDVAGERWPSCRDSWDSWRRASRGSGGGCCVKPCGMPRGSGSRPPPPAMSIAGTAIELAVMWMLLAPAAAGAAAGFSSGAKRGSTSS